MKIVIKCSIDGGTKGKTTMTSPEMVDPTPEMVLEKMTRVLNACEGLTSVFPVINYSVDRIES